MKIKIIETNHISHTHTHLSPLPLQPTTKQTPDLTGLDKDASVAHLLQLTRLGKSTQMVVFKLFLTRALLCPLQ